MVDIRRNPVASVRCVVCTEKTSANERMLFLFRQGRQGGCAGPHVRWPADLFCGRTGNVHATDRGENSLLVWDERFRPKLTEN